MVRRLHYSPLPISPYIFHTKPQFYLLTNFARVSTFKHILYCVEFLSRNFHIICDLRFSNKMNCGLMLTYDTPALWQTGSRNLTGPKTLPTICYTYMMLVTKYQISAINSYWEKCDEKYLGQTEVKQYTPLPLRGAGV